MIEAPCQEPLTSANPTPGHVPDHALGDADANTHINMNVDTKNTAAAEVDDNTDPNYTRCPLAFSYVPAT